MTIHTLLVAVDLSENTSHLIQAARSLLLLKPSRVILLHVVPPAAAIIPMTSPANVASPIMSATSLQSLEDNKAHARERLSGLVEELGADVPVTLSIVAGSPASLICDIAAEEKADLILAASHGHGLMHRIFLGSTAQHVVNHGPCHVLIMRPGVVDPTAVTETPERMTAGAAL